MSERKKKEWKTVKNRETQNRVRKSGEKKETETKDRDRDKVRMRGRDRR